MPTDVLLDNIADGGGVSSSGSRQWNHTVSSGLINSILVVELTSGSGTLHAATSVLWDFNGANTPLTFFGKVADTNNNCYTELWYLLNPSPGTKPILASYASNCEITAGSSSHQYVNQTTPWNPAGPQTNTGTIGTSATVAVTSALHEMVIGCLVENGGSALTNAGGQSTIHFDNIGAGNSAGISCTAAGASSVTLTVNGITSGNTWSYVGGSLQFDGGGAAAPADPRAMYARRIIPMRPGPTRFIGSPFRFDTSRAAGAPLNGASSTALTFGMSADASVLVQAASSNAIPFGMTADGTVPFIAPITSQPYRMMIPMRPTAGGLAIGRPFRFATTPGAGIGINGDSSTSLAFGSSADGSVLVQAASSVTLTFGATEAGSVPVQAASLSPIVFGTTAAATHPVTGNGSMPIPFGTLTDTPTFIGTDIPTIRRRRR